MSTRWRTLAMGLVALWMPATAFAAGSTPATPNFNVEAVLRPAPADPDTGFGLVKFRQPRDDAMIVYLDVWVRDLAPSHAYLVQRATDLTVNDECTGSNWTMPTLGQLTTDATGTGHANLSRDLSAIPLGREFDIQFRVYDATTTAVVLESDCYQFTVSR